MIIIYSKQRCPKCEEIKDYIDKKGFVFESKDITNDLILLTKFRQMFLGAGFPVVEFEDGSLLAGDTQSIKERIDSLIYAKE